MSLRRRSRRRCRSVRVRSKRRESTDRLTRFFAFAFGGLGLLGDDIYDFELEFFQQSRLFDSRKERLAAVRAGVVRRVEGTQNKATMKADGSVRREIVCSGYASRKISL